MAFQSKGFCVRVYMYVVEVARGVGLRRKSVYFEPISRCVERIYGE